MHVGQHNLGGSATFLYCHFITVSSSLELIVIAPNQYRFLARTGSVCDCLLTVGCCYKPAVMWTVTAGFSLPPIIF
jgi:hypothetical protein